MRENKRYTLRFPFRLAPGQEFSNLDQPYKAECSNLSLRLGALSGHYFFSIEETGKAFIPKLWAGLMWALLHQGISPVAESSPQTVIYTEDPSTAAENLSISSGLKADKLDSILDGSRPAVYDSDKTVRVITGHPPTSLQRFLQKKPSL